MLKKFIIWFICFGLSFLVSNVFGWTEQGRAFIYIYLGGSIISILGSIVFLVIAGFANRCAAEVSGSSFLIILIIAVEVAIVLFATWGATKLFDIDFFVAYQIMTFGQCLCTDSEKKDD